VQQALSAAEGRADLKDADGVAETSGGIEVAVVAEGEQAAEARHLSGCEGVVGVRREPGIPDLSDAGIGVEELRDPLCGRVVVAHAWDEALEAAEQEPSGVGVGDGSELAAEVTDHLDQSGSTQHDAGEQVVVSAEVLGGGVDDEVGAGRERLQIEGGREGRVDDPLKPPVRATDLGEAGEVGAAQKGVGWGLAEHDAGLPGTDRGAEAVEVVDSKGCGLHAPPGEGSVDELGGGAVAVRGPRDM
jgi:hypothetical protein